MIYGEEEVELVVGKTKVDYEKTTINDVSFIKKTGPKTSSKNFYTHI